MPAVSRDLEKTLSKAIMIADGRTQPRATSLLGIHRTGSAICRISPDAVALAEMFAVVKLAREHQHPHHRITRGLANALLL